MSTGTPTATALPTYDSTLGAFVIGTMLAFFLQGFTLFETIVFFSNCRKSREPWWSMRRHRDSRCRPPHRPFTYRLLAKYDLVVGDRELRQPFHPRAFAMVVHSRTRSHRHSGVDRARILRLADLRRLGREAWRPDHRTCRDGTQYVPVRVRFSRHEQDRRVRPRVRPLRWVALGRFIAYFHYINQVSNSMAGPFERSSKTVIKVALIILMTNGLSASAAVIATVLFGSFRHANWHAIAQLCLAKLLALSLLIALNARTLLADMLGVDAGTFYSIGARPTKKAPIMYNGVYVGSGSQPDGIYGRAAGASFDALGKTLRSPGPNSSFNHGGIVEGEGGVVYPISVLRQGASLENGKDGDGTVSRASSFAEKEPISFDDELEHGSRSRQPFARATSDQTLPAPTIDHPYSNV
ncbi:RHTO0S01e06854g1_1 [Rhodotorula toruloides]|uniref:RHTO0S01e06854g1_1 n=1 Tax=Rhodotorula toruloides TaxID=5286 RepID=A0A061AF58_RHOTO|nr:RHTO0S01e06854g1_1 [Rhodotorula toruloides]